MSAVFTVGFIVMVMVCGYFVFKDDDDQTWRGW